MTKETLTVHKALAELKLLDARIIKVIDEGVFCAANKHSNEKINGIPVEDFKVQIKGTYDRASDLIRRHDAIKKAVSLSNAKTMIKIAGEDYSVAEAIYMKNHGIEYKSYLLERMKQQLNEAQAEINLHNGSDLEKRADQYVTGIYGSKEGKTNSTDIEKVRNDFLKANSYELVDPIRIKEKIDELEKEIDNFMAEVDSALSVSNALTEITIEY